MLATLHTCTVHTTLCITSLLLKKQKLSIYIYLCFIPLQREFTIHSQLIYIPMNEHTAKGLNFLSFPILV